MKGMKEKGLAHITLAVSEKRFSRTAARVRRILLHALHALKLNDVSLELHILSDAKMRAVNKATRGKNVPTNVLSFEAEGFPYGEAGNYLGEIYLAPDTIKARKESPEFLAVHGLFHLLGYTHEEKRDTMKMEQAEDALLAKLAKRV